MSADGQTVLPAHAAGRVITMRSAAAVFLFLAVMDCAHVPAPSELSVREIEQLSFEDAYRFWCREKIALTSKRTRDAAYSTPAGMTDSRSGEFTPSTLAALECRLGREAHLHEGFLREQLAKDAEIHRILEASPQLCAEYGIASKAQVVRSAEGRYYHRTTDGWSPQVQQQLWLKALNKNRSEDGAGNGIQ